MKALAHMTLPRDSLDVCSVVLLCEISKDDIQSNLTWRHFIAPSESLENWIKYFTLLS